MCELSTFQNVTGCWPYRWTDLIKHAIVILSCFLIFTTFNGFQMCNPAASDVIGILPIQGMNALFEGGK